MMDASDAFPYVAMTDDIQREIVGLVWHETDERVEITYAEGEPDRGLIVTQPVVTALAEDIGLTVVPSPEGMLMWAKEPEIG